MLMPRVNTMRNFFGDSFIDDFFGTALSTDNSGMMSTDVKEVDNGYEVIMNLPGYRKEDVKGELKDGYLTVTASTNSNSDKKDEDGNYIRRERYSGTCSRSFYVGDTVKQEDIKAKFENGTLRLFVPKKEPEKKVDEKHYIEIEG